MKQVNPKNLNRVGKIFNLNIMRTNYIFVFLLLGVAIFTGCSKNNISYHDNRLTSNPYDYLGEIHNKGMSKIKSYLENNKIKSESDIRKKVADFMVNIITKDRDTINQSDLKKNIDKLITHIPSNNFQSLLKSGGFDSINLIIENSNLTSFQKESIDSVLSIINNNNNRIKENILQFEHRILIVDKPINEKAPVLAVIAIAKYSCDFWEGILSQKQLNNEKDSPTLKGAVLADASGAVSGAIQSIASGASETGLVFGSGGVVLTTAGAAVAGGLIGSALYLGLFGWL